MNLDEEWTTLRNVITESAEKTIGFVKRENQNWFVDNNEKITRFIDAKRKLFYPLSKIQHLIGKKAVFKNSSENVKSKLERSKIIGGN